MNANIIELVLETDGISRGHAHYLHYRPMIKDSKITKVRMVYDASSNATGPSLKDCLYLDPVFLEILFDLLLRFRINRIAFISHIEKAFPMLHSLGSKIQIN